MHGKIELLCEELLAVATAINAGGTDDRPLCVVHTWLPAISPAQLASQAQAMVANLIDSKIETLDPSDETAVVALTTSLTALRPTIIPHMFNGNAPTAAPHLIATLNYATNIVSSLASWRTPNPSSMPSALAKRLQRAERDLENLLPDLATVESRLTTIKDAYDAAENLPSTLQELRAARSELMTISTSAAELLGVIKAHDGAAKELTDAINASAAEANTLAEQCAEAHQYIVSTGLAASFATRANELKTSLRWWVGALSGALLVGMGIGAWRLSEIGKLINAQDATDPNKLWLQMILSILSVGAPVWFAWMSTKQIGQRFRLAEDYAFKASVATAYEGYRKQAAKIDPQLEKALFSSALTRLDEQPLRLVENATHGSPLHELSNSAIAQSITSKAGDIVEKVRGTKGRVATTAAE